MILILSYFMKKSFTGCEIEVIVNMSLSTLSKQGCPLHTNGYIQWFPIALPLHITSISFIYLLSSLSLQQDGDEVGLRDGAGGAQDIL